MEAVSSYQSEENKLQDEGLGRRLADKNRKAAGTSNTLVVTITKPMHYTFDPWVIQNLLDQGAFDLLSRSLEKTHGPMKISSFYLRDPPGHAEEPVSAANLTSTAAMPWMLIAGLAGVSLLALAVPLYRRFRQSDYIKVEDVEQQP
jgi:hypothetical protein